jgi:hypothetical protein
MVYASWPPRTAQAASTGTASTGAACPWAEQALGSPGTHWEVLRGAVHRVVQHIVQRIHKRHALHQHRTDVRPTAPADGNAQPDGWVQVLKGKRSVRDTHGLHAAPNTATQPPTHLQPAACVWFGSKRGTVAR